MTTATEQPRTQSTPTNVAGPAHEESLTHYLARQSQLVFRWGVMIFAATTAFAIITFYPLAIIPGGLLALNLVLLAIAKYVEQRTYHEGDPHDETAEEQAQVPPPPPPSSEVIEQEAVSRAVESRTAKIIAGILVTATIIALGIAAAIFDLQLLILGGFILFVYILFVTTPVWIGWLNDEAEEETHRVEERLHKRQD